MLYLSGFIYSSSYLKSIESVFVNVLNKCYVLLRGRSAMCALLCKRG